ncbi:MAG: DUF4198 domain-containing protein [Rhodospirillales bacterium]|nr:DUF4198 domain-containing protein [Rhodospirillales bacterium]
MSASNSASNASSTEIVIRCIAWVSHRSLVRDGPCIRADAWYEEFADHHTGAGRGKSIAQINDAGPPPGPPTKNRWRRDIRTSTTGAIVSVGFLLLAPGGDAQAHFQVVKPSTDTVTAESGGNVLIDLIFTHPMERGPVMTMERPQRFGVKSGGTIENLDARLRATTHDGKQAWQASYEIKTPADYVFFVEAKPYWEPSEGKMIVHYAKVVVDAYGAGEGWDELVGLPVEIRPLTRPYGVWTGNVFRGVLERDGRPVPDAEVEVEWMNDSSVTPPSDVFITQVVKTDAAGEFAYGLPRAGWWGFAALTQGEKTMKNPAGKDVPVELGALMWIRAVDMK